MERTPGHQGHPFLKVFLMKGFQEKTFKKRCPRCPGVPIIYYNINNNIIINIIHFFHDFFNLNIFFLFSNSYASISINHTHRIIQNIDINR
jgi:hypothetical protein